MTTDWREGDDRARMPAAKPLSPMTTATRAVTTAASGAGSPTSSSTTPIAEPTPTPGR